MALHVAVGIGGDRIIPALDSYGVHGRVQVASRGSRQAPASMGFFDESACLARHSVGSGAVK